MRGKTRRNVWPISWHRISACQLARRENLSATCMAAWPARIPPCARRPWPLTNENGAAMFSMDADDPLKFCELLRDWVTVSESKHAPLLRYEVFFPIPVLQGVQLLDAARLGATT